MAAGATLHGDGCIRSYEVLLLRLRFDDIGSHRETAAVGACSSKKSQGNPHQSTHSLSILSIHDQLYAM